MTNNRWRLVGEYGVSDYCCGLKPGQLIRLSKAIDIKTRDGKLTGKRFEEGEIWTVLTGAASDPGVVYLRRPAGDRHTWDDDQSIFKHFEIVEDKDSPQS